MSCEINFLVSGDYFYFVGNHDAPKSDYAIVTEFEAWEFRNMPAYWSRQRIKAEIATLNDEYFHDASSSSMSIAVKNDDKHCIVTNFWEESCAYFICHYLSMIRAQSTK